MPLSTKLKSATHALTDEKTNISVVFQGVMHIAFGLYCLSLSRKLPGSAYAAAPPTIPIPEFVIGALGKSAAEGESNGPGHEVEAPKASGEGD